ncbi:MAG: helix-turn-helix domain-containing protein [bacterium]
MASKDKNYLTIQEVAKKLEERHFDITERTVYRYVQKGKIRAIKIGGWRIEKKDFEKFLEESSNTKK